MNGRLNPEYALPPGHVSDLPGCIVNRRLKLEYPPNLGSKAKLSRKFRMALAQGSKFNNDFYLVGVQVTRMCVS